MKEESISCVLSSLGHGGAERVLINLANEFKKDGYDVIIYTIRDNEQYYELEKDIKIVNMTTKTNNKYFRALARFLKLRKCIKNDNSSSVIIFERFYGIPAALFTGKKVIGAERNDPYSNLKPKSFMKKFRDWLYKKCDVVVFQTDFAKNYFSEEIKKHGIVIPNPIAQNLPTPYTGQRENKIVAVCRLEPQKNLFMLLEAFNVINKKHPDYKLVIYGEGHLREVLQNKINTLNCKNNVKMPGFVTNIYELINNASMYVSSSDYEGISNSMLEALALGLPTICTDCPAGGAALAINNKENGMLVPVGDTTAIYQAMNYIIENPEDADKMSKNAVKVRERFSIEKIYNEWKKLV